MKSVSWDFTVDWRKLKLLYELDRRGTIAATAEAMYLTPSAVSQQLAGLARDIGVPLLERRGRTVVLTGQARVLLSHAEGMRGLAGAARAGPGRLFGRQRGLRQGRVPRDRDRRAGRAGHRPAAQGAPRPDHPGQR